jgi:hypothetical protein
VESRRGSRAVRSKRACGSKKSSWSKVSDVVVEKVAEVGRSLVSVTVERL